MIRRLAAGLAIALALAGPGAAEDVTEVQMTPAAAQTMARQALSTGQTGMALAIAEGLLAANPDDIVGLMVVAAVGPSDAAVTAGRRAFRLAEGGEQRFEAAWLTGKALTRGGRHEAAKLWMRRAMAAAPAPAHSALAERGFLEARQRSPLRLSLTASVGPSDNVNGGSLHDTFWFSGIPFAISEQLPGGTWSLGAQGTYRLSEGAKRRTELTFGVAHRGVWLSDEAKALAPEARARDFAQGRAEIGLRHRWRPGEAPVVLRADVTAGQQWQAGRVSARDLRLGFGADWQATDRWVLSLGLSASRSDHALDARRDATSRRMTLSAATALQGGGQVALSLGVTDTTSRAADVDAQGTRLGVIWRPAAQPFGISADLSLGIERRDYPRAASFGTDTLMDAAATFGFTRADYMGFIPEVSVNLRRTRSDFTPRDTREVGVGFGIRSKF